jgi:hypothetical protein
MNATAKKQWRSPVSSHKVFLTEVAKPAQLDFSEPVSG